MIFVNINNTFLGVITLIWVISIIVCFVLLRKKQIFSAFEKQYKDNINYKGTSFAAGTYRQITLIIMVAALLTVLLLRPINGIEKTNSVESNLDVVLVTDISLSMGVEDVNSGANNRLEEAQKIMNGLLNKSQNDRFGIVSYSHIATTEVPLTLDKNTLKTGIDTLRLIDYSHANGSSAGVGINEAIKRLTSSKDSQNRKKIIFLFGDGEDYNANSSLESAAKDAQTKGIVIYAVAIGSAEGGKIPYFTTKTGTTYYITESGGQVVSKMTTKGFQTLAQATGGKLLLANENTVDSLLNALDNLRLQSISNAKEIVTFKELYYYLPPLLIFIIFVLYFRLYERVIPIYKVAAGKQSDKNKKLLQVNPFGLFGTLVFAISVFNFYSTFSSANLLYSSGNYQDAAAKYSELLQDNEQDPRLQYNLGVSLYRSGEYTKAIHAFGEATKNSDNSLKEKSFYNLGNSYYRQGELTVENDPASTINSWENAISNYQEALKIDPNDKEAQENLDFVKKKLDELKQNQTDSNQNNNGQNDGDKKRIEEAEQEAKDRYNQYGRYRNNDAYKSNNFVGTPGW